MEKFRLSPGSTTTDQPHQSDQLMLPTWVKVTKSRFNEIRSMITEGKESRVIRKLH